MENYKVITDKEKLIEFINWLPELEKNEAYYIGLFSRSKYVRDIEGVDLPHIRSDKQQLFKCVTGKGNMLQKIEGLERKLGTYYQYQGRRSNTDNFSSVAVPQEALALYITINPRNKKVATYKLLDKLIESIKQQNFDRSLENFALSAMHTSVDRRVFSVFDFDVEDREAVIKQIKDNDILPEEAVSYLYTRGGLHVIVKHGLVDTKNHKYTKWHPTLMKMEGIDKQVKGTDMSIPVPGTYQGGYTPKLYY